MSQGKIVEKPEQELINTYGRSSKGNFGVIDTISVTHPYCVGTKHIEYSTTGILDIPGAEEKGARCYTCQGLLKDHETALLVECLIEPKNDTPSGREISAYLKKCIKNKHFKERGFVGFSLLDKFSKEKK